MKRFFLRRVIDVSGVSGIGNVLEGCQFDNGTCAVIWLSDKPVKSFYDKITDVIDIHGHGGCTMLVWVDDESANVVITK